MSHTLHRLGAPTNLLSDYVILAMSAKGINEAGSASKLRRFLEIALSHDPINYGDMKTGNKLTNSVREILDGVEDVSIVHSVFTDEESVIALLQDLKEEDLGVSVVVSGLFDGAKRCANSAGLRQHTVEYSLGIWGRVERLPRAGVLQITTMCGHGMVAADLVEQALAEMKRGKLTEDQAALRLARPCVCGVFNQSRAAHLLREMSTSEGEIVRVRPGQTSL